jgi:hypothetical protein
MFRRLAREAVIFMLLGMLLAAVGGFVYMHHSEAVSIRNQRDALKRECDGLAHVGGEYWTGLADGRMTTVAECNLVFGTNLVSITPDNPETLPPDFFSKRDAALAEGTRIKNLKIDNAENALVAGIVGLYGFAGGIALWILYRLVRFAVKG